MNTPTLHAPKLAYLVSAYPAVSHTFILREVQRLRALGQAIVTASINRPDRALEAMDPLERQEAQATYGVKADGVRGALAALGSRALRAPVRLLGTLARGWRLGGPGRRITGLAWAVEAAMVARWMRREGTSHLHVHFGNAAAAVGVLVKQLDGCHLSFTIHGPDEFDDVRAQQLATKVGEADAVVCISQFVRGQLMRLSDPVHWPKLQLCRLGVDPQAFPFRRREPHDGTPLQMLCVGRLTPAKGQVLLVQACAKLRDAGVPFQLTLVGAGPDRARVEAAVAAAGLAAQVTLTGALNQAEVRERFARADLFVLPSLAEGIPVVLMEAMASGVPCVTTPVNGIPELVEDGRTGLLARPGDVDDLARALSRLAGDAALRGALVTAAREKVRADFDLARNVAALAGVFARFPQPGAR